MEKEMNEKKKQKEKTKSITKKAKKMRSIVMMSLLCVLLLSAATYAWFTLSKTAQVNNLTMTVGEATGLQIAPNAGSATKPSAGTYGGVLKFGDTKFGTGDNAPVYKIAGKLLPATSENGTEFKMPVYDAQGAVTSLSNKLDDNTAIPKLENGSNTLEGYYYETTFYLKSLGKDTTVQLRKATGSDGKTILTSNGVYVDGVQGTYVLDNTSQNQTNKKSNVGSAAIRISLTSADTTKADNTTLKGSTIIYEPNFDDNSTGTAAVDSTSAKGAAVASTSKQSKDGTFDGTQSPISLAADTDTLITMRIWIEGTDDQCVNEINLKNIIAQLQFEEVTTTEGN